VQTGGLLRRRGRWLAGDGCVASRVRRLRPDIVLMDITMPKMEGVGGSLPHRPMTFPEARIVMVSPSGTRTISFRTAKRRRRHFVQKPVKPEARTKSFGYVLNDAPAPVPAATEVPKS